MKFKPRILAASLAAIMPYHVSLAADDVKPTKLEEVVVSASKIDTSAGAAGQRFYRVVLQP